MEIVIHHDGKETGPFSEKEVQLYLQTGALQPTDLAWSEGEDSWKPLASLPAFSRYVPVPVNPVPIASPGPMPISVLASTGSEGPSPRSYLALIRSESCYRTLRSAIDMVTIGACLIVAMGVVIGILLGMDDDKSSTAANLSKFPAVTRFLLMIASGLFGIFIIMASRQAALIFCDVADLLIHAGCQPPRKMSHA